MDWGIHIAIAVLAGLFIVTYIGQRTIVREHSMESTLYENDQLIVEKISPRLGKLHRGDIVTAFVPEFLDSGKENVIKRVIGLEGDEIEIKEGKVFLNGKALDEAYVKGGRTFPVNPEYASLTVLKGKVFLLGDNRMNSKDSRSFGPVDLSRIRGRAVLRYYPFNKFGIVK